MFGTLQLTTKPMQLRCLLVSYKEILRGIVKDKKISSADCKNCMRSAILKLFIGHLLFFAMVTYC